MQLKSLIISGFLATSLGAFPVKEALASHDFLTPTAQKMNTTTSGVQSEIKSGCLLLKEVKVSDGSTRTFTEDTTSKDGYRTGTYALSFRTDMEEKMQEAKDFCIGTRAVAHWLLTDIRRQRNQLCKGNNILSQKKLLLDNEYFNKYRQQFKLISAFNQQEETIEQTLKQLELQSIHKLPTTQSRHQKHSLASMVSLKDGLVFDGMTIWERTGKRKKSGEAIDMLLQQAEISGGRVTQLTWLDNNNNSITVPLR